jgi:hypothetical protein
MALGLPGFLLMLSPFILLFLHARLQQYSNGTIKSFFSIRCGNINKLSYLRILSILLPAAQTKNLQTLPSGGHGFMSRYDLVKGVTLNLYDFCSPMIWETWHSPPTAPKPAMNLPIYLVCHFTVCLPESCAVFIH